MHVQKGNIAYLLRNPLILEIFHQSVVYVALRVEMEAFVVMDLDCEILSRNTFTKFNDIIRDIPRVS